MDDPVKIAYTFRFDQGTEQSFELLLSRSTLSLLPMKHSGTPPWTELNNNKCTLCTLDAADDPYCPVARNLADIVEQFRDYFSYETVSVTVATEERNYSKDTTIQVGLSSLIGIIMVTSGCPVMEYLRPMVRFHLPFATIEETVFRMTSMYLISQYFLAQEGVETACSLEGMEKIFSQVTQVNAHFAQRLSEAAKRDANVNALVNLDCFAIMALEADQTLAEIKPLFSAYLKQ